MGAYQVQPITSTRRAWRETVDISICSHKNPNGCGLKKGVDSELATMQDETPKNVMSRECKALADRGLFPSFGKLIEEQSQSHDKPTQTNS
jgi:hypothetical protein